MFRAKMVAYSLLKLLLVFCVIDQSLQQRCTRRNNCRRLLRRGEIVPKYAERLNSTGLRVNYAGKNYRCGDSVPILDNLSPPTLTFNVKKQCKLVTVVEILISNPDISSTGPYLLWLVHNIPAADLAKGFKGKSGNIVAEYASNKEVTGITGRKSLVFLIYCQRRRVQAKRILLRTKRIRFKLKKYAKKKQLGNPVAASVLDVKSLIF